MSPAPAQWSLSSVPSSVIIRDDSHNVLNAEQVPEKLFLARRQGSVPPQAGLLGFRMVKLMVFRERGFSQTHEPGNLSGGLGIVIFGNPAGHEFGLPP